jgi:hypothetical protein
MGQKEPFKPRQRVKPEERLSRPSFNERISRRAKDLEEQAWQMPPGPERDALLRKARKMNVSEHLMEWLSSPGLQPPK